jgi:hypothetical protein
MSWGGRIPFAIFSLRRLGEAKVEDNPDLRVWWLPSMGLFPLSSLAPLAQKILEPGRPAVNGAKVFGVLLCITP